MVVSRYAFWSVAVQNGSSVVAEELQVYCQQENCGTVAVPTAPFCSGCSRGNLVER
jgi:uncharacterized OB-fold protein